LLEKKRAAAGRQPAQAATNDPCWRWRAVIQHTRSITRNDAMHVLVVGGAGYIGSHMVKLPCQRGFEVTVLDNLSAGYRDAV
jgi:pyruvate/2-oxoglutarate dehydrogenase complex dihydrolipoamide dehydrogenase (E3) component